VGDLPIPGTGSLTGAIHQEIRSGYEERLQKLPHFFRQQGLVECPIHQLKPAVASTLPDRERSVTLAQARMATLLDIRRRSAESINQKVPEPLLGGGQIIGRIHGAQ